MTDPSRAALPATPPRRTPVYRGLPRPVRVAAWRVAAALAGAVVGVTAPPALEGLGFLVASNPALLPWLAVRALGFLAFLALAASVFYGLMLSTKLLDAVAHRPITIALHQDLSLAAIVLTALHGGLMMFDDTYAFSVAQVLVPFASPYAALAIAAGQVAGYLALAVHLSFYVRRRIGQRVWRLVHYTTFVAFLGAAGHGVAAGSDSGTWWAFLLYVAPLAGVAFLMGYRVVVALAKAASPPSVAARPTPARQAAAATQPLPAPVVTQRPGPTDVRGAPRRPRDLALD